MLQLPGWASVSPCAAATRLGQCLESDANRSAAAGYIRIQSAKTVTIGRRGFSVAGPAAWKNLSTTLKDYTLTFTAFKKLLKSQN